MNDDSRSPAKNHPVFTGDHALRSSELQEAQICPPITISAAEHPGYVAYIGLYVFATH